MEKRSIYKLGAFAFVGLFSLQANAGIMQTDDNLLVNGSFEEFAEGHSGTLTVGGQVAFLSTLPGWTGSNGIEIQADGFLADAAEGKYYAELNAHSDLDIPYALQQEFATEVGQAYELTFYAKKRQIDDGSFSVSVGDLNVEVEEHVVDDFVQFTYLFNATEEISTLEFLSNQDSSDTVGHFLDNVSVTAVPLPGALALFAGGLIALGGIRKKS